MNDDKLEVERRTDAALAAIRQMLNDGTGEWSVDMFISHHLEELDSDYWIKVSGTDQPSPETIIGLLERRSHWGGEGKVGIDVFDLTLPGGVTNCVLSVRFDEHGQVGDVQMESRPLRTPTVLAPWGRSYLPAKSGFTEHFSRAFVDKDTF